MEEPKVSVVVELRLGRTGVLAAEYPELTAALRRNDRLKTNQTFNVPINTVLINTVRISHREKIH